MPYSKVIQRKIKQFGIIRFSKSSGTRNSATFRKIGTMMDELVDDGESGIVWALHHGRISVPEAYTAYRKKGARGIKALFHDTVLSLESFNAFADSQDWVAGTRRDHLYNCNILIKFAQPGDRLAALPDILKRYRETIVRRNRDLPEGKANGRRLFNYVRRTALQWIGSTQGKTSETYHETKEINVVTATHSFTREGRGVL